MTLSREAQIAEAGAQIAPDPNSGASVSDTATERMDSSQANAGLNDNPNPEAVVKETAPAVEKIDTVDNAPPAEKSPQKRSRDEIAARFKANRPAADTDQVFDDSGNHLPSWLKPTEEAPPAPANDQAANDDKPETFKLKVLGNELSVTFDELAKQAGLEPDEAKDLPKASLIRLAQKNAAADAYLDEAKATVKSARTARAPGDTQPEAEPTTTKVSKEADPSGEPNDGQDEADQPDAYADIVKEIQFGDEKEAAKKLRDAIAKESRETTLADQQRVKHEAVQRDIGAAVTTFEAANADVISDPDLGPIFYGRYLVDEVKNHLIASGKVTKENADRVIQSPADALAAYEGVKVAGVVQMPDPATMLTNALTRFRGKFPGAAAPGNQPEATRTLPAMADRQALKRLLPSQPSRSGVPLAVAPGKVTDGQAPQARASIVERMRMQRSANGRGLSKAA